MKGSASRPSSATMNGTRWAIRPATKATSRDNRSSLDTTMLHLALRAAANAAASCGLWSRASAPFPVSASVYSLMIVRPSEAAKRSMAARWLLCRGQSDAGPHRPASAGYVRLARSISCRAVSIVGSVTARARGPRTFAPPPELYRVTAAVVAARINEILRSRFAPLPGFHMQTPQ
jgi:hypothetical protein